VQEGESKDTRWCGSPRGLFGRSLLSRSPCAVSQKKKVTLSRFGGFALISKTLSDTSWCGALEGCSAGRYCLVVRAR